MLDSNRKYVDPDYIRKEVLNGVNGTKLNTNAIYDLFKKADCSFKIGRKWLAPADKFFEWLDRHALTKGE